MPASGDHLGVVDLVLNNDDGAWKVADAKAQARPIYDKVNKSRWWHGMTSWLL